MEYLSQVILDFFCTVFNFCYDGVTQVSIQLLSGNPLDKATNIIRSEVVKPLKLLIAVVLAMGLMISGAMAAMRRASWWWPASFLGAIVLAMVAADGVEFFLAQ